MTEITSNKALHNAQLAKTGATFGGISLERAERFLKKFPDPQGQVIWKEENSQRPRNIWLREVKIPWFGAHVGIWRKTNHARQSKKTGSHGREHAQFPGPREEGRRRREAHKNTKISRGPRVTKNKLGRRRKATVQCRKTEMQKKKKSG